MSVPFPIDIPKAIAILLSMKLTELQERWLKELESGKHKQCQGRLYNGEGYCCLGVFKEFVLGHEPMGRLLSCSDADILGLFDEAGKIKTGPDDPMAGESLASLNDHSDLTFAGIAEFIRANPEKVFKPQSNS